MFYISLLLFLTQMSLDTVSMFYVFYITFLYVFFVNFVAFSIVSLLLSFVRVLPCCVFFFFKQKTAYEMRISDWSSDVCSSDLSGWVTVRWPMFFDALPPGCVHSSFVRSAGRTMVTSASSGSGSAFAS